MKMGGYFWGLFASLYCCSHAHKSFVYTMALISKELHKLYSSADYYGLDYWRDMHHAGVIKYFQEQGILFGSRPGIPCRFVRK